MYLRIMVTGSRDWKNAYDLSQHLTNYIKSHGAKREDVLFILGDARGADAIAREYCNKWGISHRIHVAHWKTEGRKAGALRNREMVNDVSSGSMSETNNTHCVCLAFLQEGAGNVGTKMAMQMAKEAGIKVIAYHSSTVMVTP